MNNKSAYSLLSKCLALDFVGDHRQSVIEIFESNELNVENFVKMADGHLVLQTIYPVLKKHDLIQYVPENLSEHLKMVYDLNSGRNKEILQQIEVLNSLLVPENIVPLYLKGAGTILDGLYNKPGERILHDIDFLVEDMYFEKTAEILLNNGYRTHTAFQPGNRNFIKHFPVLYNERFPAFVEIHRIPVINEYARGFSTYEVLRNKIYPAMNSDCFVMSNEHKAIHIFIHSQLENKGYFYANDSLRNLYDLLLLSKRVNLDVAFLDFGHYKRKSAAFLEIMYNTFGIKSPDRLSPRIYSQLHSARYFLNRRYRYVNFISTLFLRMFLSYIRKPILAITDKDLRKSLIKKLGNRGWYTQHFERYRKKFYGK